MSIATAPSAPLRSFSHLISVATDGVSPFEGRKTLEQPACGVSHDNVEDKTTKEMRPWLTIPIEYGRRA
jgi:hypothetical protein